MVVHHALNQSAAVDTFWYTMHRAIHHVCMDHHSSSSTIFPISAVWTWFVTASVKQSSSPLLVDTHLASFIHCTRWWHVVIREIIDHFRVDGADNESACTPLALNLSNWGFVTMRAGPQAGSGAPADQGVITLGSIITRILRQWSQHLAFLTADSSTPKGSVNLCTYAPFVGLRCVLYCE